MRSGLGTARHADPQWFARSSLQRALTACVLSALATCALAEQQRFIACPIYRDADAGRKSGCWLVDEGATGQRFDISKAPTKPDWNYEVLVEGEVDAQQDDACGGIVLNPVRVSILPGTCTRHMLPAEGYRGRVFVLPKRNIQPLNVPRPKPERPFTQRTFYQFYDFDKSFLVYQLDDYFLDQAITYIRGVNPKKVVVTGYAATEPVQVSGRTLVESKDVARARAESVAESLRRLGVTEQQLDVHWQGDAKPVDVEESDGVREASRRRAEIVVYPGS
jgi:outer membrane protein OmpA-like peptidoglycan-associated protein